MSSSASKTENSLPPAQSYEEALQKLDAIVTRLEEDNPPLTELVTAYEEGMKLFKLCEERLRQAELRIEVLQQKSAEN